MPTTQEIEKVMAWCEEKLKQKGRPCIERNPFGHEIRWAARFPLIYIDIEKEKAEKTVLVYESENKKLWQYIGREWIAVFADINTKK